MARKRIGFRNHRALIQEHNGNQDDNGQPTYTVEADWLLVEPQWPVEMVAASGGERLRGRQVAASVTHVLFGEYFGAKEIRPDMRCIIDSSVYGIVSVLDKDGTSMEMRVEVKRET